MYDMYIIHILSVKFGEASASSGVARMPGAQAASANDMSAAERGEFSFTLSHMDSHFVFVL